MFQAFFASTRTRAPGTASGSRCTDPERIEPGTSVSIGWDRPLGTFFVQVLRPHPHLTGEDETVAWHGAHPGELTTAAAAVTIASRWADLPADLAITLETDRLMTLGQSDGEAQIAIKRRFFGD
ncbi:MAG: hypothetical protein OSB00_04460 [Sphingomonas bacterium]|nr:hypothetical protein [Sphingomonas bacterium]